MPLSNVCAVVLAAGQSKRFLSKTSKLLTKICGKEMISFPLSLLESLDIKKTFVLGHEREQVSTLISKKAKHSTSFVYQNEQLGTGHALACSRKKWCRNSVLALNGDMPLVTSNLVKKLITEHKQKAAAISFVAFKATDPGQYGRVFCADGKVEIVEWKDCSDEQRTNNLVNAGLYIFAKDFLEQSIDELSDKNASAEFYLTDLVAIASSKDLTVNVVEAPEAECLGVNTVEELEAAEAALKARGENIEEMAR